MRISFFERAARLASYLSNCGKELAAPYRSGESPSFEEGVLQNGQPSFSWSPSKFLVSLLVLFSRHIFPVQAFSSNSLVDRCSYDMGGISAQRMQQLASDIL